MRSEPSRTSQKAGELTTLPPRRSSLRQLLSVRLIASLVVSLLCACLIQTSAQNQASSATQFVDVTASAGIRFTHFKGNKGISINLEEFGPGVCVADFDGDGWPDIYFVNGRDLYGRGIKTQNALYHNNGDGTFTDVTDKAGVP